MAGKVTYSIVADDEKAKRQINRFFYNMEKQSKQANSRLGRLNQKFSQLGKDLKSYALGAGIFGGITAGIKGAQKALTAYNQELERASNLSQQLASTYANLAQVSTKDTTFSELKKSADKIRKDWGVDKSRASDFIFSTKSVGQYENRDYWAKLLPWTQDTGNIIKKIQGLQTSFGQQEAGGVKQVLNKGLKAAALSETTPSKLLPYASKVAKYAEPMGAGDEETLAALAATAEQSGVEEAATGLKGFSKQLAKQGRTGGLLENFRRIKKKQPTQTELYDILNSEEAVGGYQMINKAYEDIVSARGKIATAGEKAGTAKSPLNRKLRQLLQDEDVITNIYKRRQEEQEKIQTRREEGAAESFREGKVTENVKKIKKEHGTAAGVFYRLPLYGAKMLEGATDTPGGTYQQSVRQIADQEDWGINNPYSMWKQFLTPGESDQDETIKQLQETLLETNKQLEENTQAQREKTTGETAPTEQTGAEPVNN